MTISTRRALAILAGFWALLLPLFAVWLWIDQGTAPWDMSMHAGFVLRLHDGLAKANLWRAYELSRFYPPLFHVLAVPASFVSTHPDAYCSGNWLALIALLWLTFLLGRTLAGDAAGLAAAMLLSGFPYVTWMGRMPMTDLTLAATVTFTLWLLVRPVDLAEPRQARLLGLSIALGLLAKFSYVLFTWAPLAQLLLRHWRATGRDLRSRVFLRPLGRALLWPLLLAGPWYVRSVPSLADKAWWHLGSGVVADEGDPPVLSVASLAYYGQQLEVGYLRAPLVLLFAAGVATLLVAWTRRRDAAPIAPARAWTPLGLGVTGGIACLLLIANKDPRYLLPLMPAVAIVCGVWLARLRADRQRAAVAACGVLAWLLAVDALFRLAPPDPTDWKVEEVARQIVPRLAGATAPLRILVVPNDEQMNFSSLDYALLRATRAKPRVERSDRALDASKLASYDLAIVVVPPPDEAPYSQGSRAAAELVLSRPDWVEESRLARGDGRQILLFARHAPGA